METDIQNDDRKFLQQSLKFYRNIDKYSTLLSLDQEELEVFKNDVKIFMFVADKHYRSFTESFIRYNITVMRRRLQHLLSDCTANPNYNQKIGEDIGIVSPQHRLSWPLGWGRQDDSLNWLMDIGLI